MLGRLMEGNIPLFIRPFVCFTSASFASLPHFSACLFAGARTLGHLHLLCGLSVRNWSIVIGKLCSGLWQWPISQWTTITTVEATAACMAFKANWNSSLFWCRHCTPTTSQWRPDERPMGAGLCSFWCRSIVRLVDGTCRHCDANRSRVQGPQSGAERALSSHALWLLNLTNDYYYGHRFMFARTNGQTGLAETTGRVVTNPGDGTHSISPCVCFLIDEKGSL